MARTAKIVQAKGRELNSIGEEFANKIGTLLSEDTRWAIDALEKAKLGPFSHTLFGERKSHFLLEKEYLAKEFTKVLLKDAKG
ncbi:MAG: hypothetical protein IPH04_14135 [Saprospirales bacterium]|nr:hypothetical protein [Saprospirales bacterium]